MTNTKDCDQNYNRGSMDNQNRITSILSFFRNKKVLMGLPLFILLIGVVFVLLVRFRIIPDPFPLQNITFLKLGPQVSIKTEYKNPFDKKTQYVNPFDTYKNPFVVNR